MSRDGQNVFGNACNTVANTRKFFVGLATVLQTPKSFSWDLQQCCKRQKVFRGTCNSVANARKFFVGLATVLQTPESFSWDLQQCCKRQKVFRETCNSVANARKFSVRLAGLPQRPRQKESVRRVLFSRARSLLCVYFMDGAGYLAIFSSHFNMPSMTNMEMRQMVRKTVQHCQMGILLYISGPIQRKRLPMAVAPSQRP